MKSTQVKLDFGVMVTREFLALVLSVRVWQVQQIEWWPNWLRFVIWDHEIAGSSPVHSTIWGCSSVWLEHLLCTQRVMGSSPIFSTTYIGMYISG